MSRLRAIATFVKRAVWGVAAVAFATSTSGASAAADRFAIARSPYAFSFPRDHAAHLDYQTEWWYYTGHLQAANGHRFGFELTFFRFGLRPGDPHAARGQSRWRGTQLYPAHFAITDVDGNAFFHVERLSREALGMGRAATDRLDVAAGGWTLTGAPAGGADRERMVLHARDATGASPAALDLVLVPQKPPAIHGEGGVSRKADCVSCASHYYSYTRLKTAGTLEYGGTKYAVAGLTWMDHEYGTSQLQKDQAGWDWFSIQLDDGREVMLYLLRQKDGGTTRESGGSIVERDGRVRHLQLADFSAAATGSWTSPHTGARYPSGWHVLVPSEHLDLSLVPQVADQELSGAVGGSYWEGAVTASAAGKPVGEGYVELTGYAGALNF